MLCKWSCLVILFFAQNIFPERLAFSPTMMEDCSISRIKLVLLRWRILEQPKPAIRLHCIKVLVLKVCDILNSYPLTESCVLQTANLHFAFSMFSMQNIYEVELYIIYFVKCLMCACVLKLHGIPFCKSFYGPNNVLRSDFEIWVSVQHNGDWKRFLVRVILVMFHKI